MSQTLDRWIYGNDYVKERTIKKFFFLEWDNSYLPKNCKWIQEKPDNINYNKEIVWNINGIKEKINIIGYLDFSKKKNNKKNFKSDIVNEKILKSNLQKCIRRGYTEKALKTANQYMEINITNFLRRLSVIMLEDVVLHESFNVIMWLICASSDYKINSIIKSYLLGIVYFLSECKYVERINKFDYNFYNDIDKINKLDNNKELSIIYSLCLRTSYGGMNNDIKRFQSFIKIWLEYFQNKNSKKNYLYEKIRPIKINNEMATDDIHISCIDFHIFPVIKNILKDYPDYSEKQIKDCIWYNRSFITNKKSINNLKRVDNHYVEIYEKIDKKLKALSYFYIYKYFDKE